MHALSLLLLLRHWFRLRACLLILWAPSFCFLLAFGLGFSSVLGLVWASVFCVVGRVSPGVGFGLGMGVGLGVGL